MDKRSVCNRRNSGGASKSSLHRWDINHRARQFDLPFGLLNSWNKCLMWWMWLWSYLSCNLVQNHLSSLMTLAYFRRLKLPTEDPVKIFLSSLETWDSKALKGKDLPEFLQASTQSWSRHWATHSWKGLSQVQRLVVDKQLVWFQTAHREKKIHSPVLAFQFWVFLISVGFLIFKYFQYVHRIYNFIRVETFGDGWLPEIVGEAIHGNRIDRQWNKNLMSKCRNTLVSTFRW